MSDDHDNRLLSVGDEPSLDDSQKGIDHRTLQVLCVAVGRRRRGRLNRRTLSGRLLSRDSDHAVSAGLLPIRPSVA